MTKLVTNNIFFLCHTNVCFADTVSHSGGASCNPKGLVPFVWMPASPGSKSGQGILPAMASSITSLLSLCTFWSICIVQILNYLYGYESAVVGRVAQCYPGCHDYIAKLFFFSWDTCTSKMS